MKKRVKITLEQLKSLKSVSESVYTVNTVTFESFSNIVKDIFKDILSKQPISSIDNKLNSININRFDFYNDLFKNKILLNIDNQLKLNPVNLKEKLLGIYNDLIGSTSTTTTPMYNYSESITESENINFTKLKDKNGRIRKLTKKDVGYKLGDEVNNCGNCIHFKNNTCVIVRGVIDKEMVSNYFKKKADIDETTTSGSSGAFVGPQVWAKDSKNWRNGQDPIYKGGSVIQKLNKDLNEGKKIKLTKEQYAFIKENLGDKQYSDGKFVEFDDCVYFNNNKDAQNGKCSQGAVDNVVKLTDTKTKI